MPIELPIVWIIVLNVAGWLAIQMGFGWAFTQMPVAWFNPGEAFGWERGGRFYVRVLRIKDWQDRLPDAARWFGGGFAKGTLAGTQRDYLQRFIQETRWGNPIIVGYVATANLPCILVQRCNRVRFRRLLVRLG